MFAYTVYRRAIEFCTVTHIQEGDLRVSSVTPIPMGFGGITMLEQLWHCQSYALSRVLF